MREEGEEGRRAVGEIPGAEPTASKVSEAATAPKAAAAGSSTREKGAAGEGRQLEARACHACGATGVPFKKCIQCKVVRYCSAECQLRDWREGGHKAACKAHLAAAAVEKIIL